MVKIQKETLKDCLEEIKLLAPLHYEEVSAFKDYMECEPDYRVYQALEDAGALHIVTARDSNGLLVGYIVDTINPSLHYSRDRFAVNDVVFVIKQLRNTSVGYKLIAKARDLLKADGVSVHLLHMKADPELEFSRLAEGLGYELLDLVYCNKLKETE